MRQSVQLARSYGVHLHTHLAETRDEATYCAEAFGRTPVDLPALIRRHNALARALVRGELA
jgi:cytosine/adenosine deaminase-related metal-dependent hydrolase